MGGGGAARGSPTEMVSGLGSARFSFPSREFAAGIFFLLSRNPNGLCLSSRKGRQFAKRARSRRSPGEERRWRAAAPNPARVSPSDGRRQGQGGGTLRGGGAGPARPSSLPTPEGPPGPGAAPKGAWSGEAAEREGHGGGMGLSRRAACCAGLLLAAVVTAGAGLLLRFLDRPRCDPPRYWHAAVAADTRRCSEVGR